MKACVSTALRAIEVQEVEKPVPGEGEVLIKVHYCGICGSDLNGFQHGDPFAPFPHIFGHETAGEIVELGGGDTCGLAIGDKVTYEITLPCLKCKACKKGVYSDCNDIKIIGGHLQGAFAEYIKVPAFLVHKIPADMRYEIAALAEPYTIASRGCHRGDIHPGDYVLILGGGTIAQCAIAVAKEMGGIVIVAARRDDRLERAKEFGPDYLVNTKTEDLAARVAEITGGELCDVVIDCTGAKPVIEDGFNHVTRGGRLVIIGMSGAEVTFNSLMIVAKEMRIIGSMNSYDQFPYIIDLLYQGKLHSDKLLTDIYPYEKCQEAFEYAIENAGKCGKVLLKFVED